MADISNLFKATIKSINSRNKCLNEKDYEATSSILSKKQRSDFEVKAKNLVKTITKLRDFLLENRKDYVNSGSLLSNNRSQMSELERDQIDADAQKIIKKCKETIILFRVETDKHKVHPQVKEHRNAVMILIESYLKVICKIYSEQKAVRVKRVVDKKKISRLEPERKYNSLSRRNLKIELKIDQDKYVSENNKGGDKEPDGEKRDKTAKNLKEYKQAYDVDDHDQPSHVNDELSPDELQMFEQENQALYRDMNSMTEEVRKIEGQVVEIAKLQEIFTEKILEQDIQINSINNTVVGTTENIKDANEEIREAIKKKAAFRVWILFFLVVCSFSLLFLDWYNG